MASSKHPIRNLTSQLSKHGVFKRKNVSTIAAFYLKLLLEEPFRTYEKIAYSRKIEHHKLQQDPIFIIGHWRSGTSFLQYLLAQDPQFGFMNKFQVVFPDIFLSSEDILKSVVNLIPESLNLIRDAQNMSINLELDSPSEIEIALTTMISPTSLHWGHIFPKQCERYFDKYLCLDDISSKEVQQWKDDYRHLIKKTSLKHNGRQLLIKSPGNACRMTALQNMYPNARFIFIHRNPYDVFYSSRKLWNTLLDNLGLQDFDKSERDSEIITVYKKLMSRYLRQRNQIPEKQLAEIRFSDFVSNPTRELQDAYNQLNIDGFEQAQPYFEQFLNEKTGGKSSHYDYEPHIIEQINDHWEFAFEQWNYSIINDTDTEDIYISSGTC
jgi:hypothetical protein